MRRALALLAVLPLLGAPACPPAGDPESFASIEFIGVLPGTPLGGAFEQSAAVRSLATDVSTDGKVVVGYGVALREDGTEVFTTFRKRGNEIEDLRQEGIGSIRPARVSPDGSYVLTDEIKTVVRWGADSVERIATGDFFLAGVSNDARLIAGQVRTPSSIAILHAGNAFTLFDPQLAVAVERAGPMTPDGRFVMGSIGPLGTIIDLETNTSVHFDSGG